MTNPKPVLLLDVDGVLRTGDPWQIFPRPWPIWEWQEFEFDTDNGRRHLWCSQAVLRFLRFLDPHDPEWGWSRVEIRWHSTWYDRCRRFLAPALGLPDWPVAVCAEFFRQHGGWAEEMPAEYVHYGAFPNRPDRLPENWWWKLATAERVVLEERRPLIWIDDELTWRIESDPAVRQLTQRADVLAVRPSSRLGLTERDFLFIADWLNIDTEWRDRGDR